MSNTVLKGEERIAFELRSLYQKYGYLPYKMSKFEEYDLYVENKEFLVGDGIITFNDTNGKLMALKPDVTLSIIKNVVDDGEKRKVCYNENVYRISAKTKQFKEIMQIGLECVGAIDLYDVYETVCLAAESLAKISTNYVLDISHLGILSAVLEEIGGGEKFAKALMCNIAEKNAHETAKLCEEYAVADEDKQKLLTLISSYGALQSTLEKIEPLCRTQKARLAYEKLETLCVFLSKTPYADKLRLDFSVVNDMNYYDDIVFKGFIDGIAEGVLSGGRYDRLMQRMGRHCGAIGFAVYLDLLEGYGENKSGTDVDTLVLYDENTDFDRLVATVNSLVKEGKSVRAQRTKTGVRYKKIIDLTEGKV